MQNLLRDLLTEKEIIEISARLEAACMLKQGETYTRITEATKLSSRTVARISDWLKNGQGGYEKAIGTIAMHHSHIVPGRD
jgi:TrpR-related protein YerC/YecD